MDFVLWKPSEAGVPGWDSPWGYGRPGWHIECSAMADRLLWEDVKSKLSQKALAHPHAFDIHGGGLDLQFPHHENEIAQSCCAHGSTEQKGEGFARVWLHNEMLLVEGKKMSKSLGNFFTVRDLLEQGYPGEVIRFVLLSTHYRKPMDWTAEKAQEAEVTLRKWRNLATAAQDNGRPSERVIEALADDLNTAGALAELHALAKTISNRQRTEVPQSDVDDFAASARLLGLLDNDHRMGSWMFDGAVETVAVPVLLHELGQQLFDLRAEAMTEKNFSKVDALKAALIAAGVEVRMSKDGVELVPGVGFDPAKLEALR